MHVAQRKHFTDYQKRTVADLGGGGGGQGGNCPPLSRPYVALRVLWKRSPYGGREGHSRPIAATPMRSARDRLSDLSATISPVLYTSYPSPRDRLRARDCMGRCVLKLATEVYAYRSTEVKWSARFTPVH